MVSAKEVFGQYFEASPPVQKSLQTLPTPVAKGAMAGLVGVTGLAGFVLTPSRRLAVNAVGGALAANVGNLARKRVAEERQKAAVPAVAALLAEGLQQVQPESLAAVAGEYGVPKKQFETQLAELYLTFMSACLNSHVVDTVELSDLIRLQALLGLSSAQVGTQIYAAARQLYSRHRAYLEDSEPSDSKKLLDKFVFLAERILSRDESPEGYRYESLRLQKLFSLSSLEWSDAASNAAVPFYAKALNSAVLEGKPVSAKNLAAVRASLGVGETTAEDMHADVYAKAAAQFLEAGGSFSAADKEALSSTQALLVMDPAASARALQVLTAPLYTETVNAALVAIDGDAASGQAEALAARQAALLLEAESASAIEADAMRAMASTKLEAALQYLRVQNLPEGLTATQALTAFCDKVAAFKGCELPAVFSGLKSGLKQSEVLALYRVVLLHYLEDLKITPEQDASLKRLQSLLELSEGESASVYQAAAGPLFRTAVTKAIGAGVGDAAAKAELDAAVSDLGLPGEVTKSIASEVYTDKLTGYTSGESILTEEQAEELTGLRAFLSLEAADVAEAHAKLCSGPYTKSVREVMGTSGIIPDEYWEGLQKLQERLCLSEETAQSLFAVEVTAKMKTFGQKAIDTMEEKQQKQQNQEQGEAGSMGIDVIAGECLNLVDFAVASKALVKKEAAGKEFEVCGANLRAEFELSVLKELYKSYLIEAFSGGNPTANERLFGNLERLALVIGLEQDEVASIHKQLGSYIIRDYVSKALKKGPLGAEETNFLAAIKDTLSLGQEVVDNLVADQQMNSVSVMIEAMFEKSNVAADDVRAMRDTADTYDIDLVDDLDVPVYKLDKMFQCELEDLIDSGALKPDDMSPIAEICEPLHVSEESAQRMLDETVQRRVSGGVTGAYAAKLQGDTDLAFRELESALKFASLTPDIVAEAKAVRAEGRAELLQIFQSSGLATPESAAQGELLKSVLGVGVPA